MVLKLDHFASLYCWIENETDTIADSSVRNPKLPEIVELSIHPFDSKQMLMT